MKTNIKTVAGIKKEIAALCEIEAEAQSLRIVLLMLLAGMSGKPKKKKGKK